MRKGIYLFTIVYFLSVFFTGSFVLAQTESEEVLLKRAQLNAELLQIEKEIEDQRVFLSGKQKESVSLERDLTIIDADIKKAQLGLRARTIAIEGLLNEIDERGALIGVLDEKTEREKQSLAQLLRKRDEIESTSLVEVILGNKNLSEFFIDLDSFESINQALDSSFQEIQSVKNATESERKGLEEKKLDEVELKKIQELEKKKIADREAEKSSILEDTKREEATYQKIIKEKEKTAAEIRVALFELRGSSAISFDRAYSLAKLAEIKTGIRPAFLLGIVAEESNLGENVGTGNWIDDMHPDRDRPVFEDICSRLGFDPDKMPVSKKPWYGWGGAMGPAQFIPSTWILYEDKITALTGNNPPNPWDPQDAFMASAILLKDNGGAGGNAAKERLAALRYLAGWKNAENSSYAFYGDDVMALAKKYQGLIDILEAD